MILIFYSVRTKRSVIIQWVQNIYIYIYILYPLYIYILYPLYYSIKKEIQILYVSLSLSLKLSWLFLLFLLDLVHCYTINLSSITVRLYSLQNSSNATNSPCYCLAWGFPTSKKGTGHLWYDFALSPCPSWL